eukprot:jgi/Ulvmu1/3889/UM018_0110.1
MSSVRNIGQQPHACVWDPLVCRVVVAMASGKHEIEFGAVQASTVDACFLHSNATNHDTAFGAIAELIDNAVDVAATWVIISAERYGDERCLGCYDDGPGMDPDGLAFMLGFGYSIKPSHLRGRAIGQFGNGFKSGTMRLGKDALIVTQDRTTKLASVGFLSQTFNEDTETHSLRIPMATYFVRNRCGKLHLERVHASRCDATRDPQRGSGEAIKAETGADAAELRRLRALGWRLELPDARSDQSVRAICRYAPACMAEGLEPAAQEGRLIELVRRHVDIPVTAHGKQLNAGTKIIISGLHKVEVLDKAGQEAELELELDFERDPHDVLLHDAMLTRTAAGRSRPSRHSQADTPSDYSLRAYLSILYLAPHFKMILQGVPVRSLRISGRLYKTQHTHYRPKAVAKAVASSRGQACAAAAAGEGGRTCTIAIGYHTRDLCQYGALLYHKGRLIEAFKRWSLQNVKWQGVVAVVEENFLDLNQNKQAYASTCALTKLDAKVREAITAYVTAHQGNLPQAVAEGVRLVQRSEEGFAAARVHGVHAAGLERQNNRDVAADARGAARCVVAVPEVPPDFTWRQCVDCMRWRVLQPKKGERFDEGVEFKCQRHPDPEKRRLGCPKADDAWPYRVQQTQAVGRSSKAARQRPAGGRRGQGSSGGCRKRQRRSSDGRGRGRLGGVSDGGAGLLVLPSELRELLWTLACATGDDARAEELRAMGEGAFAVIAANLGAQIAAAQQSLRLPPIADFGTGAASPRASADAAVGVAAVGEDTGGSGGGGEHAHRDGSSESSGAGDGIGSDERAGRGGVGEERHGCDGDGGGGLDGHGWRASGGVAGPPWDNRGDADRCGTAYSGRAGWDSGSARDSGQGAGDDEARRGGPGEAGPSHRTSAPPGACPDGEVGGDAVARHGRCAGGGSGSGDGSGAERSPGAERDIWAEDRGGAADSDGLWHAGTIAGTACSADRCPDFLGVSDGISGGRGSQARDGVGGDGAVAVFEPAGCDADLESSVELHSPVSSVGSSDDEYD